MNLFANASSKAHLSGMSRRDLANALKLFLPSWNFFSDFARAAEAEYRLTGEGLEKEGWLPLHPSCSTKSLKRMFFNPLGNLELLERSHFDRAEEELAALKPECFGEFMKGSTYAMLCDIVLTRLNNLHPSLRRTASARFQFRISRSGASGGRDWLFVSASHGLDGAMSPPAT